MTDRAAEIRQLEQANAGRYREELAGFRRRARALVARGGDRQELLALLHPNGRALVERIRASGPWTVVLDECHHLLEMWVRPYIDIRIVPTDAGAHAGLAGPFTLMEFDRIEPVVFVEAENSSLVIEGPTPVKGYQDVLKSLDRIALDAEESRRRISKYAT